MAASNCGFFSRIRCLVLFIAIACTPYMANAQARLYPNSFALEDVKLLDGPFSKAEQLNRDVLLSYNTERLLAGFRRESGRPAKATSFPNWDGLDGHIAGHYLSALAMNAASGSIACRRKMDTVLQEMEDCQAAFGTRYPEWAFGYIGAIPKSNELWSRVRLGDLTSFGKWWVPWYNLHKTYAGLRDAWVYTGNEKARKLFLSFCDWAIAVTSGLSDQQMETMLNYEHGGMNEIFADAYQLSGSTRYLEAAKRFSHKAILSPLEEHRDALDNKHANTQVPKAVGFGRIGELGGENNYMRAAEFFWQTVTHNRTVVFGGNSRREFFPSAAASMDYIREVEGPETCNSNNMLRLTELLFRQNPRAEYADFYERTLLNHILSSQHPKHGGYVYFTPLRPASYRVYSAPNQAMWCCVGTGMENHSKYGEFIYTHQGDSLYLNLFISSELRWNERGVVIAQKTNFPFVEGSTVRMISGASEFTLFIRHPSWVKKDSFRLMINGHSTKVKAGENGYVGIRRFWKKGDRVKIELPMRNSIETLPNTASYLALMHGPVVLAARNGKEDLKGLVADEGRWGHIASGRKIPIDQSPVIIIDRKAELAHKIKAGDKPLHFSIPATLSSNGRKIDLEPFYSIHDERYTLYWKVATPTEFAALRDSVTSAEKEKENLDRRTVDLIFPGEQQPEADHLLQSENSVKGEWMDQFSREASKGGYFSYEMQTGNQTALVLRVRYWGADRGRRKYEIYIDDQLLQTEDNTDRWKKAAFVEVEYPVSTQMLKGKSKIRIRFQAIDNAATSPVYHLRLMQR